MGYIVLKFDDGFEYIGYENNDFINKFLKVVIDLVIL